METNKLILDEEALRKRLENLDSMISSNMEAKSDQTEEDRKKYGSGLVQWAVNGNKFFPTGQTAPKLPAGWYDLVYIPGVGFVPQMKQPRNDDLIELPDPVFEEVITDVDKFWAAIPDYRKYGFAARRGILLYGVQGTGKTGLIYLLANHLVEQKNGVVFDISSPDMIHAFETVFNAFREIEPDTPVIVTLEDIDNFMRFGGSTTSKLLNILDGNMQYDNVVFLATTNFPEVLLASISNRPSRFDRRYEIKAPSEESRRVYITHKFKELPEEEVTKLVGATEGFTIDMLKETVLSIYVLKYEFDQVINLMKKLFTPTGKKGFDSKEFYTQLQDTTETEKKVGERETDLGTLDEEEEETGDNKEQTETGKEKEKRLRYSVKRN